MLSSIQYYILKSLHPRLEDQYLRFGVSSSASASTSGTTQGAAIHTRMHTSIHLQLTIYIKPRNPHSSSRHTPTDEDYSRQSSQPSSPHVSRVLARGGET